MRLMGHFDRMYAEGRQFGSGQEVGMEAKRVSDQHDDR